VDLSGRAYIWVGQLGARCICALLQGRLCWSEEQPQRGIARLLNRRASVSIAFAIVAYKQPFTALDVHGAAEVRYNYLIIRSYYCFKVLSLGFHNTPLKLLLFINCLIANGIEASMFDYTLDAI